MIQSLQICGGMTQTIFPQVEALLLNGTEYQKSLEFVGSRKNIDRYNSLMDFFFCEIFDEYKVDCFKYYNDTEKNPKLKDIITLEQLVIFNNTLLKALEISQKFLEEKRRMSWLKFRFTVLKAA